MDGFIRVFPAHKREFVVPGLHVHFSTTQDSQSLKGVLTSSGVSGILEGEDCGALDTAFHVFILSKRLGG